MSVANEPHDPVLAMHYGVLCTLAPTREHPPRVWSILDVAVPHRAIGGCGDCKSSVGVLDPSLQTASAGDQQPTIQYRGGALGNSGGVG